MFVVGCEGAHFVMILQLGKFNHENLASSFAVVLRIFAARVDHQKGLAFLVPFHFSGEPEAG